LSQQLGRELAVSDAIDVVAGQLSAVLEERHVSAA
jgi:hypothetical protein